MNLEKKSIAVIGCGRFGANLALMLTELGHEVLAIDRDREVVNRLGEQVTFAVCVDVVQEAAFDELGLRNMDCAVIGMSSNFEASIMATAICKEKGVPTIIAKARNERHTRILKQVGADRVVLPEQDMGVKLAYQISNRSFYEYIELSSDYAAIEISVPDAWVGKTLEELDLRAQHDVNIIGIMHEGAVNINPEPKDHFEEGDHVLLLGPEAKIREL